MKMLIQGALVGGGIALVLVFFEYTAIMREVAERSKRVAKKVEWDSNQKSRLRGMIKFGVILPFACAVGAWWVLG